MMLLLAIFSIYILYRVNKVVFFLLPSFIVTFIWCIASLTYIEHGNYISEQRAFGFNIGSTYRYFLYQGLFLLSTSLTLLTLISSRIKNYSFKPKNLAFLEFFTSFFYLFIILVFIHISTKYNLPLLTGNTRFEFYKSITPLDKITYLIPICALFIGINNAYKNKTINIIKLISLALILIFFGDKFSGLLGIIIYYMLGFYISKNIQFGTVNIGFSRKVLIFYIPLIFFSLLASVIVGFIYIHGADSFDIFDRIMSRAFALQAHVWYGVDSQLLNKTISHRPEVFFLQNREPEQPAGLVYLMYMVSDYDLVYHMRESGIRFTNGFPAIVLASFGYYGSIFVLILLGIILSLFLFYLYLKIEKLQPLRLSIILILYNNIIINYFVMGESYYIYKPLLYVGLFIMLFDLLIIKQRDFKIS